MKTTEQTPLRREHRAKKMMACGGGGPLLLLLSLSQSILGRVGCVGCWKTSFLSPRTTMPSLSHAIGCAVLCQSGSHLASSFCTLCGSLTLLHKYASKHMCLCVSVLVQHQPHTVLIHWHSYKALNSLLFNVNSTV